MRKICLVGAGFIARAHAEALRGLPGVHLAAVVDPNAEAAQRLAKAWNIPHVFASVEAALAAGGFDCAHVLVPPPLHHLTALKLLEAGKPVLLEKPLAIDSTACAALLAAAETRGVALGVNQNFVHHPAFARLRHLLDAGTVGRPRFVGCLYNVPLRQLAAGQFGHWMFDRPGNLLLEQAVHPLSQILALAGPLESLVPLADGMTEIAPGVTFCRALSVSLACQRMPAQLRFAVGQDFPFWQVSVIGDDGVITADILANRTYVQGRTRWMDAIDGCVSGWRTSGAILRDATRNLADYALATLKLRPRSDPFFRSMRASIAAFHAALDAGTKPALDGAFGAALVTACERIGAASFPRSAPAQARPADPAPISGCDVAVLGGTGFIGTHLVQHLLADGLRVAVMARNIRNLPAVFHDPRVVLHRGDIRDKQALATAIGEAPIVVNLAHGGAGGTWEEIRDAMVGGAEAVASVCQAKGVRRLVHVGSIASLYLGPQPGKVTGKTPPDPQADARADYARAKALCDRMLLDLHAREKLPVCILRPGVVVGAGSSPFHGGLGFCNNEQHCIGWNGGRNPLPFVLVEDVAEAIVRACHTEQIEGQCYNLVGDVRPNARDYIAELGAALGRKLRYHPQSAEKLWLQECAKWVIKRIGGRRAPLPSRRNILSRGLVAEFDCSDAKQALGWHPVADRDSFRRHAILVHAAAQ
jgi:predicted dehydrogenase/nucleoside-diphosphate-sugar epimerase